MIDHAAFRVKDVEASKRFYEQALAPLGYELVMELENFFAFGQEGYPRFAVRPGVSAGGSHVAFTSPDRATVDAFYEAAIAAGGKDNGPPGLREHYHPTYYASFVGDPDGNNVEAVCHTPE